LAFGCAHHRTLPDRNLGHGRGADRGRRSESSSPPTVPCALADAACRRAVGGHLGAGVAACGVACADRPRFGAAGEEEAAQQNANHSTPPSGSGIGSHHTRTASCGKLAVRSRCVLSAQKTSTLPASVPSDAQRVAQIGSSGSHIQNFPPMHCWRIVRVLPLQPGRRMKRPSMAPSFIALPFVSSATHPSASPVWCTRLRVDRDGEAANCKASQIHLCVWSLRMRHDRGLR
jgi:hypothetical protein